MEPFGLAEIAWKKPEFGLAEVLKPIGQQMLNNFTNKGLYETTPPAWHPSQGGQPSIFAERSQQPALGEISIYGKLDKYAAKYGARFDDFWEDMGALLFTDNKTGSSIIVKYGDLKDLPKKITAMRKEFAQGGKYGR